MNLKQTFIDAKREARRKMFSKEDQIELCYLEKHINDYGFGPWHVMYVNTAVQQFSTIVEMKGEYKPRYKAKGENRSAKNK